MSASELLTEYGYTEVNPGHFLPARPSSERWVKVDGGFECYAVAGTAAVFGGSRPWGRVIEETGLVQVPFEMAARFKDKGVSGVHPADAPEFFEWVWPEERLVEIYEHAPKRGEGNQFVKVDGEYKRAK